MLPDMACQRCKCSRALRYIAWSLASDCCADQPENHPLAKELGAGHVGAFANRTSCMVRGPEDWTLIRLRRAEGVVLRSKNATDERRLSFLALPAWHSDFRSVRPSLGMLKMQKDAYPSRWAEQPVLLENDRHEVGITLQNWPFEKGRTREGSRPKPRHKEGYKKGNLANSEHTTRLTPVPKSTTQ